MATDRKRGLDTEIAENENTATSSKRIKTGESSGGKSLTENTGEGGKEKTGNSEPQVMSLTDSVNVQNAIYAAERLSCSMDMTHSLNFILQGKL